jgi:hypothetical protein
MKNKINERLRKVLSKHFVIKLYSKVGVVIKADRARIVGYWQSCDQKLKQTSLCFFSKELIELVNNTNTKLLYADFLIKTNTRVKSETTSDEYHLLNAFELLWNVDNDECEKIAMQSVDELNLVEIMSHEPKASKKEESKSVMGHALTVKLEYLDQIVSICTQIRPKSFLQYSGEDSPMFCDGDSQELVLIPDESMLIRAID